LDPLVDRHYYAVQEKRARERGAQEERKVRQYYYGFFEIQVEQSNFLEILVTFLMKLSARCHAARTNGSFQGKGQVANEACWRGLSPESAH